MYLLYEAYEGDPAPDPAPPNIYKITENLESYVNPRLRFVSNSPNTLYLSCLDEAM